jgi:hypothetical protein
MSFLVCKPDEEIILAALAVRSEEGRQALALSRRMASEFCLSFALLRSERAQGRPGA